MTSIETAHQFRDESSPEIRYLLDTLRRDRDCAEVWLIGSRANGTAGTDSDWDFLVFGRRRLLTKLATRFPSSPIRVDLLIVWDGNHFRSPWTEPGRRYPKKGSLASWRWRVLTATRACYMGSQPIGDDNHAIAWSQKAHRLFKRRKSQTAATSPRSPRALA